MKYDNQLRYAVKIIENYNGKHPLQSWLKDFYRSHSQMGSNDRRQASNLVYNYFRLGHAVKNIDVVERILLGLFLCNSNSIELLSYFKPEWNDHISVTIEEKIAICHRDGIDFQIGDIFPWKVHLSPAVDHISLCKSFLIQPDLFIRARPGFEDYTLKKLHELGIPSRLEGPAAIRLPNGTAIDKFFSLDKEIVVQDLSSQRVGGFFDSIRRDQDAPLKAWDACAGSGGKSILLYDNVPGIDLTVSDVRTSILANLKKRFEQAGIRKYNSFVADLAGDGVIFPVSKLGFDLLVLDAPCSGSGTWSRTPEALCFFEEHMIDEYSSLQEKMLSNTVPMLKKGGSLFYITCSVFRKENEDIASFIRNSLGLEGLATDLQKGYAQKADSMFISSFRA